MKRSVLTLVSLLLLVQALFATETGSITGIVLDERSSPVAGAKVYVVDAHKPFIGPIRYFGTDDEGSFRIPGLPFGEYRVFAKKEEDGYPDTGSAFYSNNLFPTAVLSEGNPTTHVIVQLPPKAAVLKCSVTDAVTGKPVNASVLFRRVADPKNFLSAGANSTIRILVPSDAPVTLEIRAPGYLPWRYRGELHLKPSETMELDIQLLPLPSKGP